MILDLSVLLAVSLSLWLNFLKFEKNMPHAVLMYRPKRRLTKRHQLRIVKLKYQQKPKLVHLNLSGIADVLWLATDGLENANL